MPPEMNPRIDQGIVPIFLAPQTLLAPATKEVIAEAASGGAWVNRTLCQLSRTGVYGSTPGNIHNSIGVVEPPSPVLIVIVATYLPCGLNASKNVVNKWQPTSPGLVGHTQKLDAVVERKLPNDLNYGSIFSKLIGHKISNISSGDLYTRCRINFTDDTLQTQTPQFMYLGLLTINSLDESSGISTPATIIQRPLDGDHWSAPDHVFGEATLVGVSEVKSDHDYTYKTEFQIWKGNN